MFTPNKDRQFTRIEHFLGSAYGFTRACQPTSHNKIESYRVLYGAHYIIFGSQALRLERSQVLRPHFCLSLVVRGRLMALVSLDSLIE